MNRRTLLLSLLAAPALATASTKVAPKLQNYRVYLNGGLQSDVIGAAGPPSVREVECTQGKGWERRSQYTFHNQAGEPIAYFWMEYVIGITPLKP